MSDTPRNVVFLSDHLGAGNGPHLALWTEDSDLLERFREIVYLTLPKSLGWFHQCSSKHYHMFEFWKPNIEAMIEAAHRIATELNLPVQIGLNDTY